MRYSAYSAAVLGRSLSAEVAARYEPFGSEIGIDRANAGTVTPGDVDCDIEGDYFGWQDGE
jgi:hypothetical protein